MKKIVRICTALVIAATVPSATLSQGGTGVPPPQDKNVTVNALPPLAPYYGPRKRAIVSAMEVKVQGVATTAPTPSGNQTVVTIAIDQPTDFGLGLTEMLTTALVNSKRFIVLERQHIEEVNKELQVSRGAEFNPATSTAAGKMLGAQVIVRGAVTELSVKRSGTDVGGVLGDVLSFGQARAESKVAIDLKVIDVATGQVLESVRAEGKAVSKGMAIKLNKSDIKIGFSSFDNSPLGLAVRNAIEDAVRKITKKTDPMEWEAKIASIQDVDSQPAIYVNAGLDSGLAVGDILEIFRAGADITDPDTGLIIGKTGGLKVGQLRVTTLQKGVTLTTIVEGSGFQIGDIVKFFRRPGGLRPPPKDGGSD
ncbi:MAG: hypothetical protein H7Y17_14685 [Chlorobia bacterium]|nr:hypothetical protein [Fimbriimonadaceae bacterium]